MREADNPGFFKEGLIPWNKKLTIEQEKEIVIKYQSGISQHELARMYDIDRTCIKRVLSDSNIQIRKTTRVLSDAEELEMFEKFQNGRTKISLAKEYDVDKSVVYRVIKNRA